MNSSPSPGAVAGPGPATAAAAPANRWFSTGCSTEADAATAAADATNQAISGRDAAIVFVFTSRVRQLAEIAAAVRAAAGPGTAIVGASTFGEISPTGPASESVVTVALGGPGMTVRTAASRDAGNRQREAGAEVAAELGDTGRPHQVMVLIPDGLLDRQHEIVRGAYSVVGASIPLAGGCAADPIYTQTFQVHGDGAGVEVLTGSVVAALIGSDGPIAVGVGHGWHPYGAPMNLTSSTDTRIHEFDHQPALDVYLRRIGADPAVATETDVMSMALTNPLGLARRSGEDIRIVHSVDLADRSMTCFADVQQGALAWLMSTDQQALVNGGRQSCEQAIAGLNGSAPIGIIEFDCGVRRIMLGAEGIVEEVNNMIESAGPAPIAGYYSMGEIARTRGARGMHHLTSVSLAFG